MQLIAKSNELQGDAQKLLASSKLLPLLSQYGRVELVGSYQLGLMTCEDIDIHVSRNKPFTKAEILKIQACIVAETTFSSSGYYFNSWLSDWRNIGKGRNLPRGYYLGFTTINYEPKWKIDIWFVSTTEQSRRRHERIDMRNVQLTTTQKVMMMQCKLHLGKLGIKLWGQKVYEAVLLDGVTTIAGFKKWLKKQKKK